MDSLVSILRDESADVNVIAKIVTSESDIDRSEYEELPSLSATTDVADPESNVLLDYMDGVGDISIDSKGDLKEKSAPTKKTKKKSKTDKRERSGTLLSGKKERRTTIIKKWGAENGKNPGTLQRVAEMLTSQTRVQV